jgi:hypothetical protein
MKHQQLCTPCIAFFNCGYLLHIRVDHAEPESEFQDEQVQHMFGGPEALSCDNANIVVIEASPSAFNHVPCLLSSILLYVLL